MPPKYRSKSSSNTGTSTDRFTIVARSPLFNASRLERPSTRIAANESRSSATETRTPFWRSRFENSISLSSIAIEAIEVAPMSPLVPRPKGARSTVLLMQEVLVGFRRGGLRLGFLLGHEIAHLVFRLATVPFVLEARRERFLDQRLLHA